MSDVLLADDLRKYLNDRYSDDGISQTETDGIIQSLRNISGTIYEANKVFYKMLCDGFILNRDDRSQKDLYISLVDFEAPEKYIQNSKSV